MVYVVKVQLRSQRWKGGVVHKGGQEGLLRILPELI